MRTLILSSILTIFFSLLLQAQKEVVLVKNLRAELAEASTDTARLRLNLALAKYFRVIPPQEVYTYASAALALAEKLGNEDKAMRARYQMAVSYHLQSEFTTSTEILQRIDDSAVFADDPEAATNVKNLLGSGLSELGEYEKALDVYTASLAIAEAAGDTIRKVTALNNMGTVYAYHIDYQKGKIYYLQALELSSVLKDSVSIAVIYNNLSATTSDPDSSIVFSLESLQIFEAIGYTDGVAYACDNLGNNMTLKKRYAEAQDYLMRAKAIWEQSNYSPGLTSVYTNLVALFSATGQTDSLEQYLKRAQQVSDTESSNMALLEAYEKAAEYYITQNNPSKALAYYQQVGVLKDSIFNKEKAEQLAVVESRFEAQEKEKQLIQNQLTIARQQNQQKNILIGGGFLLLSLIGIFQFLRNRQRLRQKDAEAALQLEMANAERLRELDHIKSTFFANISHEFRTPLTLIQTPLRQALANVVGDQVFLPRRYAKSMSRNTRRLLHLVNQLLDLAKLESGKMQLQLSEGDLAHFIRTIGYGFESMALRKQINYHVNVTSQPVYGWYDIDKLELILSNLLSNAFKFTSPEGRVRLEAEFKEEGLDLMIKDNGIGIPAHHLPHIFDRFYSVSEPSEDMIGSGIGMALTQELVTLYRGTISVESEENQGTTFFLSLPFHRQDFSDKERVKENEQSSDTSLSSSTSLAQEFQGAAIVQDTEMPSASDQPLVLVVEDNADLRAYTRDQLADDYQVILAINGKEGLSKAMLHIPDLIITDIMMPEMNGYELCERLRKDEKTCHIPIIMLTAKAERSEKLEGLSTGADDYLTKPFDALELKIRTKNLIEQRRLLRERFAGEVVVKPRDVATSSVDEKFLTKVYEVIEQHLEEETFSVVDLAQMTALSRSQLNRKLKALTGKSPNHIIRDMRLFQAKELLEKKTGNASEIAFSVGFSSLSYFSKCFKDRFGVSPSEL